MFQLVVAVGLSLNIANLIGYVRCKKDAGKKIKTFAGNFLGRQLLNQVFFSFKFKKILSDGALYSLLNSVCSFRNITIHPLWKVFGNCNGLRGLWGTQKQGENEVDFPEGWGCGAGEVWWRFGEGSNQNICVMVGVVWRNTIKNNVN